MNRIGYGFGIGVRPVSQSVDAVHAELSSVELTSVADGAGHPGQRHDGGWIGGLSMARLLSRDRRGQLTKFTLDSFPAAAEAVRDLLAEVVDETKMPARIEQVMLNELAPGAALKVHSDGPPDHMRFHLPLATSKECTWWDEIYGSVHMHRGFWWGPVPYCGYLHSMTNNDPKIHRLHMVVDIGWMFT